jgi:hypothetical protein
MSGRFNAKPKRDGLYSSSLAADLADAAFLLRCRRQIADRVPLGRGVSLPSGEPGKSVGYWTNNRGLQGLFAISTFNTNDLIATADGRIVEKIEGAPPKNCYFFDWSRTQWFIMNPPSYDHLANFANTANSGSSTKLASSNNCWLTADRVNKRLNLRAKRRIRTMSEFLTPYGSVFTSQIRRDAEADDVTSTESDEESSDDVRYTAVVFGWDRCMWCKKNVRPKMRHVHELNCTKRS